MDSDHLDFPVCIPELIYRKLNVSITRRRDLDGVGWQGNLCTGGVGVRNSWHVYASLSSRRASRLGHCWAGCWT